MISERSFKNPFSEYNANVMDSAKILEYWCSPLTALQKPIITEDQLYEDNNTIIFVGGRGSGKTMFLKYFSYHVQRDEAKNKFNHCVTKEILNHLKERGGIGVYLRFDGPALRSFTGKGVTNEIWDCVFTHFFELQVAKLYMDVIFDLIQLSALTKDDIGPFAIKLCDVLGNNNKDEEPSIEEAIKLVEERIAEVTEFRGRVAFCNVQFNPTKVFVSKSLSFGIPELARTLIMPFNDMNFKIFIDEYENFLPQQQRIVNTLIKFVENGITFRIGMRLEGIHTTDTISENEFIMENRDYSKVVFENLLNNKEFLIGVAKKRLESTQEFKMNGLTDISKILGVNENIESEATELVARRSEHFDKTLGRVLSKKQFEYVRETISYPDNPLFEMLNILWVIRGKQPEKIAKAMNEYICNVQSPDSKKYENDYVNKYKLTLMFLLASIYKSNKHYYSFNTFYYLSSGVIGNFIELCRRTFQRAYFEDPETLFSKGTISKNIQTRATKDFANTFLDTIKLIPKYGKWVHNLTMNLGNIFRQYHTDILARYPETNQFTVNLKSTDNPDTIGSFKAALEWSVIQKKVGILQSSNPGEPKTEIYVLNKVLAPLFEISYRTRGGINEDYSSDDWLRLIKEESVLSKKFIPKQISINDFQQELDFGGEG